MPARNPPRAWPRAALAAVALAALPAAKPKEKAVDLFWTHPGFEGFAIRQVALIPAVTFDRNLQAAQAVERAFGAAFAKSGHRWLSATFAKERLRAAAGGADSLLRAVEEQVKKGGRLDSLSAPGIARILRSRAMLTVRVDAWEKREVEPTQRGRASTFVWLKAALVDSTGALLWTASGSERMEGAEYDPQTAGLLGMRQTDGIAARPTTSADVAAPRFELVLDNLLARFAAHFPPPPVEAAPEVPAAPAPADSAGRGS